MNRRGYYEIGSLKKQFDVQQLVVKLENSLYLFVPEKENGLVPNVEDSECSSFSKENMKVYRLNDIGDLQSKLMLIGGQEGKEREVGQIEKDCFLQVFQLTCCPYGFILLTDYTRTHGHTVTYARTHARTHARTPARTQIRTHIYIYIWFSYM